MKKWFYPVSLILLFIILITAVIPDGYVYGSNTDWLSQHVTLAETIRNACLEQHTLLPSWIGLGGGSNGYQFAYYGFLRPDILIGCLLPQIPMVDIIIGYMTAVYLCSVLLVYIWLRSERISPLLAWLGSMLFMTAGCLFHMHRQIIFVNYLPFMLLAFLCIRKQRYKWLPLCLLLICLSSFYFSISAFAAVGWYWYRTEGKRFWRGSFLKRYIPAAALAAAMAAALLLPTALVLLEHSRLGTDAGLLKLLELFGPNPVFNNILFNEYGMGLTLICFYAILAGLKIKNFRKDSILFLMFGMFGIFSYVLNGTLYTRPKILIPFMPLVILHCVRYAEICRMTAGPVRVPEPDSRYPEQAPIYGMQLPPLWPFAVMLPVSLLWFSQEQFPWILLELAILFCLCLAIRLRQKYARPSFAAVSGWLTAVLLLISPVGMYLTTAGSEDWVKESEISPGFTADELSQVQFDPLYHFDSLLSPLVDGNELNTFLHRSTMYSSVTNGEYSELYYDTLMTPVRINNRVALLTSDNPFMLNLLGVRYLETTDGHIPAGYETILESGKNVIVENPDVLPSVYFTDDTVSQEWFDTLDSLPKLDIITRKTVVEDSSREGLQDSSTSSSQSSSQNGAAGGSAGNNMRPYSPELSQTDLPEGLDINRTDSGWEIRAEKECTLTLDIGNPQPGSIVLCQFEVENLTTQAVVIDINNIRNKLSGMFAPYPNGNDQFHYQFSADSSTGVDRLEITFSKGHYRLNDIQWYLYDQSLLNEKNYAPLTADQSTGSGSTGIMDTKYTITAENDGYIATSIPMQNGLEILVDGKPSELVKVNQAFAGTYLEKGEHTIEFHFSTPGKTAGCAVSTAASIGYVVYLLYTFLLQTKRNIGRKRL
ncbi:MAG TPA: YfhO family protein [Candidatus Mediterraneibacter ornithocaccae]|nr:YfhO family protein [Candidatus Mediterraneibacter ornithocaccae]